MPSKALTNAAILKNERSEITQFILKVNMVKSGKESLIEIDLNMNPYDKIYNSEDVVLNEKSVNEAFDYITKKLFKSLKSVCSDSRKKSSKDINRFERIGRIRLKKNSPATVNVSYVSSHNGDMQPPM
jgi:hypothetical protein